MFATNRQIISVTSGRMFCEFRDLGRLMRFLCGSGVMLEDYEAHRPAWRDYLLQRYPWADWIALERAYGPGREIPPIMIISHP